MRSKLPALREALDGRVDATHRILLRQQLDLIDFLQGQIEQLCVTIDEHLHPYESQIARLMQIPGIGRLAAAAILAEIGTDMSRFPSAKHLASWATASPWQSTEWREAPAGLYQQREQASACHFG